MANPTVNHKADSASALPHAAPMAFDQERCDLALQASQEVEVLARALLRAQGHDGADLMARCIGLRLRDLSSVLIDALGDEVPLSDIQHQLSGDAEEVSHD